jgi:hypothetical protein
VLRHGTHTRARMTSKRKEWRERNEWTTYRYEGAEVVRDNVDDKEDVVLRHHGRSLAERRSHVGNRCVDNQDRVRLGLSVTRRGK